ncbi:tRNA-2-methylthio-N(6)-dimethylallyladenosine synthase [Buchnera aphidicola (Neophyllaphis podocarpi)]|uniref:tRNA (N6-isopentenyl adenosine(37)-C2)-methylthiotransferase MiaB n=1 Tax=Buchnera aphidicola TaxID=9 RepID=UPI003463E1B5
MNKKIHIKTWGCQMNEYDSLIITRTLQKDKYTITKVAEEADVLILNTCSIREKAQEKLFHQLGRWKKIKEKKPKLIIAVGGCVAAQEGKKIKLRAKYIDIIFGPRTLNLLPNMIKQISQKNNFVINIDSPKIIKKFNINLKKINKGIKTSISIMEGCNKYCSFCIVPHTRGTEISRPHNSIISEISELSHNGTKEITLLGQNVNAYRGKNEHGEKCNFADLIRRISLIKEIKRIRFITSHPVEFNEEIINLYKEIPKLASFLHLPVQSGSDKILKLMKRRHTIKEYKNIIKKILKFRPNMQFSSDFIIGFPGETESDFNKTLKLVKEIKFDFSFSFIYSPRPGTLACNFVNNTTLNEKKNRLNILQKQILNQGRIWTKSMLNTKQEVLVEGYTKQKNNEFFGTTENNRTIYFNSDYNIIGKLVIVKIKNIYKNKILGKII